MDNTHRRWMWPAVLILPLAFVQWVPAQVPTLELQIVGLTAYPGSVIHIPISAFGGTGGTAAVQFDIVFSTSALTVPDPANACTAIGQAATTHVARASLPSSPPSPPGHARLRLLILDQNIHDLADPTDTLPTGGIAACTFQIRSDAPLGTFLLDGQRNRAADRVGNVLPSNLWDGTVTVTNPPPPCNGCC